METIKDAERRLNDEDVECDSFIAYVQIAKAFQSYESLLIEPPPRLGFEYTIHPTH